MNKILTYIFAAVTIACGFASCSDGSDEPTPAVPPEDTLPESRAVLVYMVADNNLSGYARDDMNEMKSVAAKECEETGGRWIVYYSGPDHSPRLIEFSATGEENVLKTYPAELKSVTIERMRDVIADFKSIAKTDRHGIVLWSHGTGWIDDRGSLDEPAAREAIDPLSYGYEGTEGARMKVTSLARALDGWGFDFIYFDCCHMATVEVAYELRNAAKIMVACPTELGVEGMPYENNIGPLLRGEIETAAQNTFAYYDQHYNVAADSYKYCIYGCAITMIDLTKMDKLAAASRDIASGGISFDTDYNPVNYFRSGVSDGIYDMSHYFNSLPTSSELIDKWNKSFSEVVVSAQHTPTVYYLNATDFKGLGCNIILSKEDASIYGFDSYGWWKDVMSLGY